MALSAPWKAVALVVFLAAIAGATYAVSSYVGDTVESQLVSVTAARSELNVTPGSDVSYLLSLTNRDVASRDLSIEIVGYAVGKSETVTVRGNTTVGVFVPLHVSDEALEGEHRLDVRVVSEGKTMREREGLLLLNVLPEGGEGFAPGDSAEVLYLGRLSATGRVFNTNDPALQNVAFAKTDNYRFSQGLLPLETVPRPNVVTGLYEGMLGMREGEHRTISFPPEKGYGPATEETREPREESIVRELTLVNDAQRVPRETFDTYVVESGQGVPEDFQAGDIFLLEQNGNHWPYRIVNMTDQVVEYKLGANAGEAYTIYPFWANASIVQSINDTTIVFRTTPNSEIGQPFTMKAYWPEMSAHVADNDTAATVRHTPPVGFTYTTVSQLGQPREATVKEVNDRDVIVAIPSANPLAGKDLTFDVIVVTLTKG